MPVNMLPLLGTNKKIPSNLGTFAKSISYKTYNILKRKGKNSELLDKFPIFVGTNQKVI
jgi:hypothetical protein